ncbi:hypothetical protein [Pseudarthrobacter sp. NIBRBAC000502770]|uniref:hypothetical protein n=1 Tax=Pseudarthrobacter sp. NIBRBAC000502770 TaxID=2590785 RepID=UPI00114074FF|nr:hypothetical protein [Pseudarthrobacter sp. NIBRBAC000502770]QDG88850.1 hypothetical protein NIBR502770_10470 [Pseudarthrobacter sp. NIBRBAC000502770]
MRPQTITASSLKYPFTTNSIAEWLAANGCRHYVPEDARIIVTGNYIIVPTLDIGRTYNARYWGAYKRRDELPLKTRKYRIRHELAATTHPALADPEGIALVQAIHDRKNVTKAGSSSAMAERGRRGGEPPHRPLSTGDGGRRRPDPK